MVTPRKWPGRERPSSFSLRPSTSTQVTSPCGIDLFDRRREEDLDAFFFQQLAVAIELARIFRQIFGRAKLRWVHEDGNGNRVALRLRSADQRQMAFMQSAHGRHQAKALADSRGQRGRQRELPEWSSISSWHERAARQLVASQIFSIAAMPTSHRRPDCPRGQSRIAHGASRNCTSNSLRVPRSRARFLRRSAFVCSVGFLGTACGDQHHPAVRPCARWKRDQLGRNFFRLQHVDLAIGKIDEADPILANDQIRILPTAHIAERRIL